METHIETRGGERGLVKKPTGFMSSSRYVIEELDKKCSGDHAHVPLVGGRAAGAQVYPQALCEAICRGVAKQKRMDQSTQTSVSTGRMTEGEVKRFATHLCSLQVKGSANISRLLSTKVKDGVTRPVGEYPDHWMDSWHEDEGGNDLRGV